jgi:hypothetical protein
VYSTWDDFFSRPSLILNEITKGYRWFLWLRIKKVDWKKLMD